MICVKSVFISIVTPSERALERCFPFDFSGPDMQSRRIRDQGGDQKSHHLEGTLSAKDVNVV